MLNAMPEWKRFQDQLQKELEYLTIGMIRGELADSDVGATATNYATNVGRASTLLDILEYQPSRGEDQNAADS